MSENIKNTAAESAQNAAGAAEAVTHDMTAEAVNEPVQADAGVQEAFRVRRRNLYDPDVRFRENDGPRHGFYRNRNADEQ